MTVVNIDDLRITRQRDNKWKREACKHLHLTFDDNGEIIECDDCGKQIGGYWAVLMLAERYAEAWNKLQAGSEALARAKSEGVHLLAARKVERAWRSRSMVPCCPHCGQGIGPNEGFGETMINAEMERRRRQVAAASMSPDLAAGGREGVR